MTNVGAPHFVNPLPEAFLTSPLSTSDKVSKAWGLGNLSVAIVTDGGRAWTLSADEGIYITVYLPSLAQHKADWRKYEKYYRRPHISVSIIWYRTRWR